MDDVVRDRDVPNDSNRTVTHITSIFFCGMLDGIRIGSGAKSSDGICD